MSAPISFALRDSLAAISVSRHDGGGGLWYVSSRDGRLCIYRVPVKATDSCCYEKGIKMRRGSKGEGDILSWK